MSWGRFDDNMPTHPKCAPLSDLAFRLMVHANLWSRAHKTRGFIPRDMLSTILPRRSEATLAGAAEELVRAGCQLHQQGLWEPEEHGWRIHDFEAYSKPNAAEARVDGDTSRHAVDPELSRKRAEAGRRGGQASGLARAGLAVVGGRGASLRAMTDHAAVRDSKQPAPPLKVSAVKQVASPPEAKQSRIPIPFPIPTPKMIVLPPGKQARTKQTKRLAAKREQCLAMTVGD